MRKFLLFLFIPSCFLLLFNPVLAQDPTTVSASISPQRRNTLQLLGSFNLAQNHFFRFQRRVKALSHRIGKINSRIASRLTKITASANILAKLKSQMDKISLDISNLEKDVISIDSDWKKIVETKNREDYLILKKKMNDFVSSAEVIIKDQKALLKEMKKYKSKVVPSEKKATMSAQ